MNQRTAIHLDVAHGALNEECSGGIVAIGVEYRQMTLIEWAVALAVIGISVCSFAGLLGWR